MLDRIFSPDTKEPLPEAFVEMAEKLEQTPKLFTATTIALVISAIVLAVLAIPIARMMKKTEDVAFDPVA